MTQDAISEVSNQQERLMQIGAHLQEVRAQQGLSLEKVSGETLIQARLLRAIEAGDMSALPEPVYIRGFVKRYADYLGLDGTKTAAAFPVNTQSQPIPEAWTTSAAAQLRPLHLYAAYIALIVAAVSGVSYLLSALTPPSVSPQRSAESEQVEPEPAAQESGAEGGNPELSAAVPATSDPAGQILSEGAVASPLGEEDAAAAADSEAPVQVSLELVERSWLRVIVDGSEEFEGVLQEGASQTWTAENSVTVRAGNAGGVKLAVNNQPPEVMGAPGSVTEQTFSPDTAEAEE
ncbi:MAG: RodZ domain-containing protein [Cyanobacteria bacterium P01_A01_bin.135]